MNYAREIHAHADPTCKHCKGEGFVVIEDDNDVESHLICDCVSIPLAIESSEASQQVPFFCGWKLPGAIPEVGEEICLSKTVMLTNPDYITDELPSWTNDSADVNPITALFESKD